MMQKLDGSVSDGHPSAVQPPLGSVNVLHLPIGPSDAVIVVMQTVAVFVVPGLPEMVKAARLQLFGGCCTVVMSGRTAMPSTVAFMET